MRMTVDDLLAEARGMLPHRPGPAEALAAQAKGALLVDIRGDDQRRADGLIPGALVLPRNSLEWRCDPKSQWRHPEMNDWSRPLILICNQGFQSSLAAATLHRLGLVNATDLDGGFVAWAAASSPLLPAGQASVPALAGPDRAPSIWTKHLYEATGRLARRCRDHARFT
jgi:rhodanese-related sulfurtransferase